MNTKDDTVDRDLGVIENTRLDSDSGFDIVDLEEESNPWNNKIQEHKESQDINITTNDSFDEIEISNGEKEVNIPESKTDSGNTEKANVVIEEGTNNDKLTPLSMDMLPELDSNIKVPHSPVVKLLPIEPQSPLIHKDIIDTKDIVFGVCVVGFHHIRGPEVEYWVGPDDDKSQLWPYLPFQSLPDGTHAFNENFCYFTLLYDEVNKVSPTAVPIKTKKDLNDTEDDTDPSKNYENVTTLFAISCNCQIRADQLAKSAEITRSTVQKSVVIILRKPVFGSILVRDKLEAVTKAYFSQKEFENREIIDDLYNSLKSLFQDGFPESELYGRMSLRQLIYNFQQKTLIIFKALLLEKKILFFGASTEELCLSQFSLISLIPKLLMNLEDCGSPLLTRYEDKLKPPSSLSWLDDNSRLTYMGLPLQIFGKGGLFGPYTPLQQIDDLKSPKMKYYCIGTTNSLFISQKDQFADVIVNVDTNTVEIVNSSLNGPLSLSWNDKKWIDALSKEVTTSWDPYDPSTPKDNGYIAGEDYIREKFKEYLMCLLTSSKYNDILMKYGNKPPDDLKRNASGNPLNLYNSKWVEQWRRTNNFRLFNEFTFEELYLEEPRHVGEDLTSSIVSPFATMFQKPDMKNIDQKVTPAKEAITKSWNAGSNRVSLVLSNLNKNDNKAESTSSKRISTGSTKSSLKSPSSLSSTRFSLSLLDNRSSKDLSTDTIDSSSTQVSTQQPQGYLSSWSNWATNKRKEWANKQNQNRNENEKENHDENNNQNGNELTNENNNENRTLTTQALELEHEHL